ncbi:MAG TPA: FtsW/RodA/SpoVE family cell cycle protein [Bryobacteraceae bacterium]|jgi:cell division protein FtsW|nr:FtsW/RodA/SpoVE family cell cycle protein [Bryobacteraceae bacterium]
MGQQLKTDWILFVTVLAMVAFGLLILYSASSITAAVKPMEGTGTMDPHFESSLHIVTRQLGWAAVAVLAMMMLKRTDYRRFQDPAVAFGAIGIVLMMLIAVYFLDPASHRWIHEGPLRVQPSEIAKPALVVFLAFFVTWRRRAINNARYTLGPAALAVGLVILLVVVPDLGTAVVLGVVAAVIFFVAGLEWRYVTIAAAVASVGVVLCIAMSPYRLARVVKFFDPQFVLLSRIDPAGKIKAQMEKSLATRDTNYQLQQSQIAVGAGGPIGVGLGDGRQKLMYLPEAHTDFIYAVVGEELGLFGTVGLLIGFGIIFWRGLRATVRMTDDFGRYLALGVTVVIVVQGMINMSVVLGMMPTKGIPLPMISYGGSSLLSTLTLLGILMNVSEHAG